MALVVFGMASAPVSAEPVAGQPSIYGVWRNKKDSVHIEIKSCGASTCGYVVWADAKAVADARKGGTPQLIGTQLLRDFEQQKGGIWKGKVFIPDLNMTFSGSAQSTDPMSIKARGCLVAGVLCKSTTWVRVA